MIEDLAPNTPIEAWTPAIGQRVRVCLNGECQTHLDRERWLLNYAQPWGEHGLVGTVVDDLRAPRWSWINPNDGQQADFADYIQVGHWWVVGFGHSFGTRDLDGAPINAAEFCSFELEPVE